MSTRSPAGNENRYYGESSRSLETRLKEHKVDLKHHLEKSALVNHMNKKGRLPKWSSAKIPKDISRQYIKAYKSIFIKKKKKTGDVVWV